MLLLQSIQLLHYKNHPKQTFTFSKKITGICGQNGMGKTNLLDAIFYLCFTKSYFTNSDAAAVMQGCQGFRLDGLFTTPANNKKVTCVVRENGKKEFAVNEEMYGRLSKHIGTLPCVMIAPDDVELIVGGSEQRRKMIDSLLCQLYPEYLQQLMDYNKLLLQRNSLLKQWQQPQQVDAHLLQVINQQLAQKGQYVYEIRNQFVPSFLQKAATHYHAIAQLQEPIAMHYQSQLHHQTMQALLQGNLSKDLLLQRTTVGPHRDDLTLSLAGFAFKQNASQGQRKSLLYALKLTEYETLESHKGFAPLLLLDDVFEKLDEARMQNLLMEVCMQKKGQVFITDTHTDRLQKKLTEIGADFEIIELKNLPKIEL